uniref:Reverse transcriptase/retrotransposon-derived protein RNase H-like domain-containing protein n=1 Tax=Amphimedon queenslandica TaxID=400682 RepID=A0A1X7T746_AMPQE
LSPLLCLLRKDEIWKGTQEQEKSFIQAKGLLHSSSLLVNYDPNKPLIISCDASPYRLGAIPVMKCMMNRKCPLHLPQGRWLKQGSNIAI